MWLIHVVYIDFTLWSYHKKDRTVPFNEKINTYLETNIDKRAIIVKINLV